MRRRGSRPTGAAAGCASACTPHPGSACRVFLRAGVPLHTVRTLVGASAAEVERLWLADYTERVAAFLDYPATAAWAACAPAVWVTQAARTGDDPYYPKVRHLALALAGGGKVRLRSRFVPSQCRCGCSRSD